MLEDFFIEYGKQDRVARVCRGGDGLPKADEMFATYKISKRREEDITATLGAFRVKVAGGSLRCGDCLWRDGGTPKRAKEVEAALVGKP